MKKLNLGSGDWEIAGYDARDGKRGDVLFPLPDADGSVDEIRASHVLEHFAHNQVHDVLRDWVRVLKPGGVLKIAVPDFEWIARNYLAGAEMPVQGFVMGGQIDDLDYHRTIFDAECLQGELEAAGLIGVRKWTDSVGDDASLPVSLNLAGTKPGGKRPKIAAVLSMPRLAFSDNMGCVAQLAKIGVPVRKGTGAFWGQCLTRVITEALEQDQPDYVLTVDYDTVWTPRTFQLLVDTAARHPEADVIAPLQCKRGEKTPLLFIRGADGKAVGELPREALDRELIEVTSAHFGLTLLKADMLRRLPKPWFKGVPAPDGSWGDGRIDDDIWFWQQLEKSGARGYVAPRVVVGHAELMIMWPDVNLEPLFQHTGEFWNRGTPEGVWR